MVMGYGFDHIGEGIIILVKHQTAHLFLFGGEKGNKFGDVYAFIFLEWFVLLLWFVYFFPKKPIGKRNSDILGLSLSVE
jgi:riboflavin transporter FmnP